MTEGGHRLTTATKETLGKIPERTKNLCKRDQPPSWNFKRSDQLSFLNVDAKKHDSIKKMFALFADMWSMWSRNSERIDTVGHRTDLSKKSYQFCCAPYRAEPEARELEEREVLKKSIADVVKPTTSEWAHQSYFSWKENWLFQFCIWLPLLKKVTIKDTYL